MSDSGHSLSTFSGYSYHVPPAYSFSKSRRDKNPHHSVLRAKTVIFLKFLKS